ncbi:MerR family transcriptional regulator [Candidatus Pelagibacter bacterium]|nr:MerR family transcriptional regulator [Candidatus Pelagibacter bacterium]
MQKLYKISEVSKLINLFDPRSKKPANHIIRFWEKEFKVIKPVLINKRRYYSEKQIEIIRFIKFMLKDNGMTIKGVKNILKNKINNLDDYDLNSLKTDYQKKNIELKSKKVLDKIKILKNYGKKNTH